MYLPHFAMVYNIRLLMRKFTYTFTLILALLAPQISLAAQDLEVSAWIPYWRTEKGVASALKNLNAFTEVNPFVYTVRTDGGLNQAVSLSDPNWQALKNAAAAQNIRFIPTVMWGSADLTHSILSDPTKRHRHIQDITREVYAYDLDGIDIDYEAKYAKTNPYFSIFLKELAEAIGFDRWIMCTIESRTPLDSRYSSPDKIPTDIEYANDFSQINKYCDRVRIMAYDQGRIDLKLNDAKGDPYVPVADVDWVRKVMEVAAKEIDKDKLVIGIPTYGYEYDTFLDSDGDMNYSYLWSFNPGYVTEVASKVGATPERNSAGEMFLTYPASLSPDGVVPLPNATRIMSWSDASAVQDKVKLAEELGVRGVALFKVDGGEDQNIWGFLSNYTLPPTLATLTPSQSVPSDTEGDTFVQSFDMPKRNMEYGERHEDVRTLQKFLNAYGFTIASTGGGSPGNETTFFGPATKKALAAFQAKYNIKPTSGYYGPITRSQMASLMGI